MSNSEPAQVAIARVIATEAHGKQVDKLGQSYIGHPARVAVGVFGEMEQAAAWLHDVIEDAGVTADRLLALGVHSEVVQAVELLTRRDDVPDDEYYAAITSNPIALAVKRADIADNLQPWRTSQLPPELRERLGTKYAHALEVLGFPVPDTLRTEVAIKEDA